MDSSSTSGTSTSTRSRYFSAFTSRSRSTSRSYTPRRRSSSPTETISSWCYIPPHEPSQATKVPDSQITTPGRGLYIRFSPSIFTCEASPPHHPFRTEPTTSKSTAARLKRAIEVAVQNAGMESPTITEEQNPLDGEDASEPKEHKTSKSLFRGTYGQVMSALKNASLTIMPCSEVGFEQGGSLEGHTRCEVSLNHPFACYSSSNATWGTFCRGIQ